MADFITFHFHHSRSSLPFGVAFHLSKWLSQDEMLEIVCCCAFALLELSLCSPIPIVNVFVTSRIGLWWVRSPFMPASARCCLSLFYLFGNWRWRREPEINCVTKMICEWWTIFFLYDSFSSLCFTKWIDLPWSRSLCVILIANLS